VAREVQAAVLRKDARAIIRRLDADDLRRAGITEGGVERFLKNELFDRYRMTAGEIESGGAMDSSAVANVVLVSDKGNRASLSLSILGSDRGLVVSNLFQSVFFTTEALSMKDRGESMSAQNRMRQFSIASSVRGARMEQEYGLRGVIDSENEFLDWEALSKRFAGISKRLAE